MKQKKYFIASLIVALIAFVFNSCVGDLDQTPLNKNITTGSTTFGNTAVSYLGMLAKCYAGFSTGGIQGGDNQLDIQGYDGGSQAGYLRPLWNFQELPTDEAMCCWNDATIQDFHKLSWTPSDIFLSGFSARLYFNITTATSFLQATTSDQLSAQGLSQASMDSVKSYRAEARFLRALCYYHVLDLYRNGGMINDNSRIGTADLPPYATSQEIFNYIESELKDCQTDMLDASAGFNANYGHANKAAAWSLLARLYLNADVYLGTSNTAQYYTNCIDNCKKVIAAGYQLEPLYENLYVTDNYNSKEIIFPNLYDGTNLTTWGGMMFLLCSAVNADIQHLTGSPAGWGGNRATQDFLARFTEGEANYQMDNRYDMLYQGFNHPSIDDNSQFPQGIQILKYKNYDSKGNVNQASFASTAFPVFRLGDIYLMYAEAVLRGGSGGDNATALNYINALRDRAEGSGGFTDLRITAAQLNLPFILEERAREMFWECTRRTDLVRFGKLISSDYLWQWKGNKKEGTGTTETFRNYYPIPATDLGANPNLKQNVGY